MRVTLLWPSLQQQASLLSKQRTPQLAEGCILRDAAQAGTMPWSLLPCAEQLVCWMQPAGGALWRLGPMGACRVQPWLRRAAAAGGGGGCRQVVAHVHIMGNTGMNTAWLRWWTAGERCRSDLTGQANHGPACQVLGTAFPTSRAAAGRPPPPPPPLLLLFLGVWRWTRVRGDPPGGKVP